MDHAEDHGRGVERSWGRARGPRARPGQWTVVGITRGVGAAGGLPPSRRPAWPPLPHERESDTDGGQEAPDQKHQEVQLGEEEEA